MIQELASGAVYTGRGTPPALPWPEIYSEGTDSPTTLASEWAGVDSWAHSSGYSYVIWGVTSDWNPTSNCAPDTPDQDYQIMLNDVTTWQSSITGLTDFYC